MINLVVGVVIGLAVGWLFVPAPQAVVDFWTNLKSKVSGK
jgi:hypothetical protein